MGRLVQITLGAAGLACLALKLGAGYYFWSLAYADNGYLRALFVTLTIASGVFVVLLPLYFASAKGPARDVRLLFVLALCWDLITVSAFSMTVRGDVTSKQEAAQTELQRLDAEATRLKGLRDLAQSKPQPEAAEEPPNSYAIQAENLEARGQGCEGEKQSWKVCRAAADLRAREAVSKARVEARLNWLKARDAANLAYLDAIRKRDAVIVPEAKDAATLQLAPLLQSAGVSSPELVVRFVLGVLLTLLLELGSVVGIKTAMRPPTQSQPKTAEVAAFNPLVSLLLTKTPDAEGWIRHGQLAIAKELGVKRTQLNVWADEAVSRDVLEMHPDPTGTRWRLMVADKRA